MSRSTWKETSESVKKGQHDIDYIDSFQFTGSSRLCVTTSWVRDTVMMIVQKLLVCSGCFSLASASEHPFCTIQVLTHLVKCCTHEHNCLHVLVALDRKSA